ncbi:MAG: hypothetical protein P8Y58_04600 [Novosphingobium sp.]
MIEAEAGKIVAVVPPAMPALGFVDIAAHARQGGIHIAIEGVDPLRFRDAAACGCISVVRVVCCAGH